MQQQARVLASGEVGGSGGYFSADSVTSASGQPHGALRVLPSTPLRGGVPDTGQRVVPGYSLELADSTQDQDATSTSEGTAKPAPPSHLKSPGLFFLFL